jgi:hypothetical protein
MREKKRKRDHSELKTHASSLKSRTPDRVTFKSEMELLVMGGQFTSTAADLGTPHSCPQALPRPLARIHLST